MTRFTSFDQIEKYLKKMIPDGLGSSAGNHVEDYLKDKMHESVHEHVYGIYTPEFYKRRGDNGGLSDKDHMVMKFPYVNSQGKIQIDFYNMTRAADGENRQHYLSDFIETGSHHSIKWHKEGPWSQPRPFKERMVEDIKKDPTQLTNAVKKALKDMGFSVK